MGARSRRGGGNCGAVWVREQQQRGRGRGRVRRLLRRDELPERRGEQLRVRQLRAGQVRESGVEREQRLLHRRARLRVSERRKSLQLHALVELQHRGLGLCGVRRPVLRQPLRDLARSGGETLSSRAVAGVCSSNGNAKAPSGALRPRGPRSRVRDARHRRLALGAERRFRLLVPVGRGRHRRAPGRHRPDQRQRVRHVASPARGRRRR